MLHISDIVIHILKQPKDAQVPHTIVDNRVILKTSGYISHGFLGCYHYFYLCTGKTSNYASCYMTTSCNLPVCTIYTLKHQISTLISLSNRIQNITLTINPVEVFLITSCTWLHFIKCGGHKISTECIIFRSFKDWTFGFLSQTNVKKLRKPQMLPLSNFLKIPDPRASVPPLKRLSCKILKD